MLFSICMVAKNEERVLSRCIKSLENFMLSGGTVLLLDTGSTDSTVKLARSLGVVVHEVGTKFIKLIDEKTSRKINERFIVGGETKIVKGGDKLFDFAEARNYIASLSPTDMVLFVDCDEVCTKMNFNRINELILEGFQQFEYHFIYAHDSFGEPAVEFTQSKFYDRRVVKWVGIVHEVLTGASKIMYLNKEIYLLEHFQEFHKEHRSNYLVGLSLDCIQNPNKDRQSHYFARELMYSGRYKSAIKEFERHISLHGWKLEAAQSMIYIGDIFGKLNLPDKQAEWYHKSFHFDSNRNEALLKLALFYKHNNNFLATLAYAKAALEIPQISYYANDRSYYTNLPHELLYWAYGWLGNITKAREHLQIALSFQPYNVDYLRDTKYYFEYFDHGIEGWMTFEELQWIYNTAKKYNSIAEIGSWKGRSTHAWLSGCKGTVTSVDTWKGSSSPNDWTHDLAQQEDIFAKFKENVAGFKNLIIKKGKSEEVAKTIPDKSYDIVFIDAGHTYEDVVGDIRAWRGKAKVALCGHDYFETKWMDVVKAVDDELGKPDEIHGTIWVKYLQNCDKIPKNIFTIWLSENGEIPNLIEKCINSQKIDGYFHKIITLQDCYELIKTGEHKYLEACITSTRKNKWVKASDYLRVYYLYKDGGIYLDADVEILKGKNFDNLLHYEMFAGKETNGFTGTAVLGARKGYPFLKTWLDTIKDNFSGGDNKNFECSVELLTKGYWEYNWHKENFILLEKDYFYPYDHQGGTLEITKNTIAHHHFTKTWLNENLPTVSIILPTLGREDGLKKCLNSIAQLNYPQNLIETLVILDEPRLGVPRRVKEGYEKSTGEYLVYASNDMEFTPDSLRVAIQYSLRENKGLVAFNTGPIIDNTNFPVCEHFVIKKSLADKLGGIFDTDFNHVGVDNLLWIKCDKLHEAAQCLNALVLHRHFSHDGGDVDEIYKLGWSMVEQDREIYKKKILELQLEKTD